MGPISRATLRLWWLIALLSAGCTSYQKTSLTEIESHPDKFIDKRVRVYYAAAEDSIDVTGLTGREGQGWGLEVPGSVVPVQITAVRFPYLEGWTYSDPQLYDTHPEHPLQVDLTHTRRIEVFKTDPFRTLLAVGGVAVVVMAIYAAMKAGTEAAVDDWLRGIAGQRSLSPSPPAQEEVAPK